MIHGTFDYVALPAHCSIWKVIEPTFIMIKTKIVMSRLQGSTYFTAWWPTGK